MLALSLACQMKDALAYVSSPFPLRSNAPAAPSYSIEPTLQNNHIHDDCCEYLVVDWKAGHELFDYLTVFLALMGSLIPV